MSARVGAAQRPRSSAPPSKTRHPSRAFCSPTSCLFAEKPKPESADAAGADAGGSMGGVGVRFAVGRYSRGGPWGKGDA